MQTLVDHDRTKHWMIHEMRLSVSQVKNLPKTELMGNRVRCPGSGTEPVKDTLMYAPPSKRYFGRCGVCQIPEQVVGD